MAKRIIPGNPFDVQQAMEWHPEADSWAELAERMGLPERWQDSKWCESAFVTVKEHGYATARSLIFPKVHKASELFESARLVHYGSGRDKEGYAAAYPNGGGSFIASSRADKKAEHRAFAPFFSANQVRYIKTRKNGEFFCHGLAKHQSTMTVVNLRKELQSAVFGHDLAPNERENRWSFEAIRQATGKILITCRDGEYIGSYYVALLDAGESLLPMFTDAERQLYADACDIESKAAACIGEDGKTVDQDAAARAGIAIRADKY